MHKHEERTDADAHYGKPKVGDWIQTYSGRKFHLLSPRPEDICIVDIAHALSNQCRFAGHLKRFYSVAEHCVRVCSLVESWPHTPAMALAALMHDADEAYLTDVPRPFKYLPEFAPFRDAESRVMSVIASVFGVPYPFPDEIKRADGILLGTEARDLMLKPPPDNWHLKYEHLKDKIVPMSPRVARRAFLCKFHSIMAIIEEMAA